MSFATNVTIAQLDAVTSSQYGFRVFDWDNNRGNSADAGKILIAKHDFEGRVSDATREVTPLTGKTAGEIAQIFKRIFDDNANSQYGTPKSIHLRTCYENNQDFIPARPFLFVLGNKR